MDWRICINIIWLLLALIKAATTTATDSSAGATSQNQKRTEVSPYIDLVFCTLRDQPWTCARQQSGRILNIWDDELYVQWQKLKVDADRQLNAVLEKRGYSVADVHVKEKPSSMLKKIEIGINYMKEYLAETMDGFLGRELTYQSEPNEGDRNNIEDENVDYGDRDEGDAEIDSDSNPDLDDDDETNNNNQHRIHTLTQAISQPETVDANASNGAEFIEIEESTNADDDNEENDDKDDAEKGAGNKNKQKRKNKNKNKKGHGSSSPSTVLLLQTVPESGHGHGHGHDDHGHTGVAQHDTWDEWNNDHGPAQPVKNKKKLKKRKNKRKHQHGNSGGGHGGHGGDESVVVLEKPSSSSLLFDLVEEFADDDLLSGGNAGHKKKHSLNYGRSNGVTRGKKKKKKKAIAKLILLGSFLKAKIELLLKILGAHLQIKFFAIALIGLLINIARFWIDVKRGGTPQKVVYVEHAHHQHHYEDHGDDWNEQGSYWKRSLQTDPTIEEDSSYTEDTYQPKSDQQENPQQFDPHYLAYRNQWSK